jgi:hypothetical protein
MMLEARHNPEARHNRDVLGSLRNPYSVLDERASKFPKLNFPEPEFPAPKLWLWPNLLSLDAPLVAVLWQILFVRCFHVALDALPAILLVSSVWLIYAADRALDAWRGECGSARHRFYRAHWRILLPVWTAVLGASAGLALTQLPAILLRRGCFLLAAVIAYFVLVHGRKGRARVLWSRVLWSKEASVGLLFALGASLAAWTNVRTAVDAASIALFFALCWINCAAIQKWESGNWTPDIDWPVGSAALGVAFVAGVLLWMHRPVLGGAEMASAFAFVALDRSGRRLSPDALRVLADVALLSPVAFLPLVRGA